jgi:hypothetical protein
MYKLLGIGWLLRLSYKGAVFTTFILLGNKVVEVLFDIVNKMLREISSIEIFQPPLSFLSYIGAFSALNVFLWILLSGWTAKQVISYLKSV